MNRGMRCLAAGLSAAMALYVLLPTAQASTDEQALWDAFGAGGHVLLMRHAIAPGTGDPPGFEVGDCSTQRNLSAAGRAQAARFGARMRANGVEDAAVFTSEWCRCRDTVDLLDVGTVTALPALNSFFADRARRGPQTRALTDWLAGRDLGRPHVLVTHQVNISALTGEFTSSGEAVVAKVAPDGAVTVVGTIAP